MRIIKIIRRKISLFSSIFFLLVFSVTAIATYFESKRETYYLFQALEPSIIKSFRIGDFSDVFKTISNIDMLNLNKIVICDSEKRVVLASPSMNIEPGMIFSNKQNLDDYILGDTAKNDIIYIYGTRQFKWTYTLNVLALFALLGLMLPQILLRSISKSISTEIENFYVNFKLLVKELINNGSNEKILINGESLIDFKTEFEELSKNILDSRKKLEIQAKIQASIQLAHQVSHDIRSPLAALEMISGSIQELPEDKRLIIRNSINRIRDIANSLLDKNRTLNSPQDEPSKKNSTAISQTETFSSTLLSPLIDSIITEKRIQYRNQISIRIDFNQTKESYGIFANIQPHEFQRVLSNLIDNSVEALGDQQGTIDLFLQSNKSKMVELLIRDNGKGIPATVLPKLTHRGETHGKEKGSGLGLFHAKETLQNFKGSLVIESIEKLGTTVTLTLPLEKEPKWFVPKIILNPHQTIVVFDDDQSIHQIWKGRIESLPNNNITILNFSEPNELRKYYGKNFTDLDEAIFLMDYEISGTAESGLDVIETLGIQSQSILVTSRYEEKNIRERCENLGIRLIPKTMSGFVPMEIV